MIKFTSSKDELKNSLSNGMSSEKPMKMSRKSLGSVSMNLAKKKLEDSISFLKAPKSKKKELLSNRKVPTIQKAKKNQTETSSFNEKYDIKTEDINNAIKGIIKYRETNPKLKNQLFDEQVPLFLEISLHKVPKGHPKLLRIPLRNKTLGCDDDICLIVADVKGIKNAEHEKHVEHYENLLQSKGITNVKKIMTFYELRTEYETFEQRSRLVDLYDIFLVDGRISGKVVSKTGKIFYKKRKVPTAVKLHVTNLQDHIEKALSKSILNLHLKGAVYSIQFGHTKMEPDKLIENLMGIVEFLDSNLPGNFENIKSLHMFAPRSTSIPVYVSLESPGSLKVPTVKTKKPKAYKTYSGELTTQLNTKVTVQPSGKVIVRRVKDDSMGKSLDDSKKAVEIISLGKSRKHKEIKLGDADSETIESTSEKKKYLKKKAKLEVYTGDQVMHSTVYEQQNEKHQESPETTDTAAERKKHKKKKAKLEEYTADNVMHSTVHYQQNEKPNKIKTVDNAKITAENLSLHKINKHKKSKISHESSETTDPKSEKKQHKNKKSKSGEYVADEVTHSSVHEQRNKKHQKIKTLEDEALDITEKISAIDKSKNKRKPKSDEGASSDAIQSSLDVQQNITENVKTKKMKKMESAIVFDNESSVENIEQTDMPIEKPKKRMKPIQVGEWTITEDDGENRPRISKKHKKKLRDAL